MGEAKNIYFTCLNNQVVGNQKNKNLKKNTF